MSATLSANTDYQKATDKLRYAGLICTPPRLIILNHLLDQSTCHVTADELHKELIASGHSLNLNTVYRVLHDLEGGNIVTSNILDGRRSVYELASDGNHFHMLDIDSGDVIEFKDDNLTEQCAAIAESHGFLLDDQKLVLLVRRRD